MSVASLYLYFLSLFILQRLIWYMLAIDLFVCNMHYDYVVGTVLKKKCCSDFHYRDFLQLNVFSLKQCLFGRYLTMGIS